jgi:hypothetical protein
MKKYIIISPFLIAAMMLLWSGCASTKKSKTAIPNYIGQWNYVLAGPEGNIEGFLKFSQEEDQTVGMIGSDQGESQLSNFAINEEQVSGSFDYMGYSVYLSGTFEGSVLKGKMSAEGYDFPFEATKQP